MPLTKSSETKDQTQETYSLHKNNRKNKYRTTAWKLHCHQQLKKSKMVKKLMRIT